MYAHRDLQFSRKKVVWGIAFVGSNFISNIINISFGHGPEFGVLVFKIFSAPYLIIYYVFFFFFLS